MNRLSKLTFAAGLLASTALVAPASAQIKYIVRLDFANGTGFSQVAAPTTASTAFFVRMTVERATAGTRGVSGYDLGIYYDSAQAVLAAPAGGSVFDPVGPVVASYAGTPQVQLSTSQHFGNGKQYYSVAPGSPNTSGPFAELAPNDDGDVLTNTFIRLAATWAGNNPVLNPNNSTFNGYHNGGAVGFNDVGERDGLAQVAFTTLPGFVGPLNVRVRPRDGGATTSLLDTDPLAPGSSPVPFGTDFVIDNQTVLAVDMVDFTATGTVGGPVTLNWVTSGEIDNVGFNVYKGVQTTATRWAPSILMNTESGLIASEGSPTSGASYSFVDNNPLVAGETRQYFLQSVDVLGDTSFYGPAAITVGGSTDVKDWTLY